MRIHVHRKERGKSQRELTSIYTVRNPTSAGIRLSPGCDAPGRQLSLVEMLRVVKQQQPILTGCFDHVQFNGRAHRIHDGHLADIVALGRGRARALYGVHKIVQVIH